MASGLFAPSDRPFNSQPWPGQAVALTCFGSMLFPPSRLRTAVSVPILIYAASQAGQTTTGKPTEDMMHLIHITLLIAKWCDFVLFQRLERDAYRVHVSGKDKGRRVDEDPNSMGFWAKFKWTMSLWWTARGIGWNWRVKHDVNVPEDMSKRQFIKRQSIRMFITYIALDILGTLNRRLPYGSGPTSRDYFSDTLLNQITATWIFTLYMCFSLYYPYAIMSIFTVLTGISEPAEWPSLFGDWTKGFKIREIWGYCYHQNLRRMFESVTTPLVRHLGLKKGGLTSRYTKLYASFVLSAAFHQLGAFNMPYRRGAFDQGIFFLMQPFAITFEDLIVHLGRHCGIRESWATKGLGFIWTYGWLSYSLRYMAHDGFTAGIVSIEHPLMWPIVEKFI